MGRPHRAAEAGYVYHVLNRANARMKIFTDRGDYEAFERVLAEARGPTGVGSLWRELTFHCSHARSANDS